MTKSPASKAVKRRVSKAPVAPHRKRAPAVIAKNIAISTELAPAVAIALLEKTVQLPGEPSPALDVMAAGVTPSEIDGKVRVQLLFENGTVLPVEMSEAAGTALSDGLSDELTKVQKPLRKRKTV